MRQGNVVKSISIFFGVLISIGLLLPVPAWAAKFAIAILPDTQFYPETNPDIFYAQTEWIKNNWKEKNIIYVAHLGDIIDSDCQADATEWGVADTAMKTLDDEGIPYGILPGNHDYDPGPSLTPCSSTTTNYNNWFGLARFSSAGFHGGSYESELATPPPNPTNDDNYTLFEFCGIKFIAINFAYTTEFAPPSPALLDWVRRVDGLASLLTRYPDRKAIITSHYMLDENTTASRALDGQTAFSPLGAAIYSRLQSHENLFLMLGAHRRGEAWRVEDRSADGMDDVHILLSDYQDYAYSATPDYNDVAQNTCPSGGPGCGDSGFMRIMEFDTDTNQVSIKTFIPKERILLDDPGYPGDDRISIKVVDESDRSELMMNRTTASNFTFPFTSNPISPSVALLLDTSGSMSWAVDGDTGFPVGIPVGEQRITLVKESAKAFLELMGGSDAAAVGARFGIATFPDHPSSACNVPRGEVVTSFRSATSTNIDNVIDPGGTIDTDTNLNPENGTPLLAGVDTAIGMFTSAEQCRTVVLLSDGYHNCGAGTESDINARIANLNANDIRLYTIGFGEPEDTDNLLYQDLANGTKPDHISSQFYDVTTDLGYNPDAPDTWETVAKPALDGVFKEILSTALGLETAADPIGVITPGATEPEIFEVSINEHDRKVAFYISWSTLQQGLLNLTVKDSGANPVSLTDAGVSRADGRTYSILTVDQEFLAQPGRVTATPWRIEVSKSEFMATAETFQYSVVMDSGLKLHPLLDRNDYAAGDTVTLTASLTEAGRPIPGLGDVEVLVSAPEDGKGNWLSNNDVDARQLARIPVMKGSETLAPFQRKGIYLTDFGGVAFPGRLGVRTISLYDDGSHGDETANDGVYSNRFSDTGKEGVYSFYFRSHGGTRGGNNFTREQMVQTYLKVRAVPEAIAIDVASLGTGDLNQFSIQATPRDAQGNYLGPGHSGRISFSATGGTFIGTVQDNLDGSYTQTLNVPSSTAVSDVQVNVTVDDASKDFNLSGRYAFSFHLGQTNPSGSFGNLYDSDINLGFDVERSLDARLSAIGELQYSRFEAAQSGLSDTYWVSLTGGLKYTLSPAVWQPYVAGGIGVYSPRSGSTEPGVHFGVGVNREINPRWSVEIGADYHNIFTSGSDVEFSVIRAGFIFRP